MIFKRNQVRSALLLSAGLSAMTIAAQAQQTPETETGKREGQQPLIEKIREALPGSEQ